MRLPSRTAAAAAALTASLAAAGHARAGAWTRPPGETFASVSASYYRAEAGTPYEEAATTLYLEHGVAEGLTLGGAVELKEPVGASEGLAGETALALFLQRRLRVGAAGDPLSLQVGVRAPLGDVMNGRPPQVGPDDAAAEIRLLYGRGFATGLGGAFLDAQGAFRRNFGADADEVRIDLTAGVRPAPRWLMMVQGFATLGLRNAGAGGADFDVFKLAPSAGYELRPGVHLLLGVEREVAGREVDLGTRLRAALWTTF